MALPAVAATAGGFGANFQVRRRRTHGLRGSAHRLKRSGWENPQDLAEEVYRYLTSEGQFEAVLDTPQLAPRGWTRTLASAVSISTTSSTDLLDKKITLDLSRDCVLLVNQNPAYTNAGSAGDGPIVFISIDETELTDKACQGFQNTSNTTVLSRTDIFPVKAGKRRVMWHAKYVGSALTVDIAADKSVLTIIALRSSNFVATSDDAKLPVI